MYFALYEDNTDMLLNVYLLLCANEVLFTGSACVDIYTYIHMWCTQVHYMHVANWIHYLHKNGYTS